MSTAGEVIATVERARAALLDAVCELSDAQAAFKPAPDVWSVVENVEHLYLAEMSGTSKIWAAIEQTRRTGAWTDAVPHRGKPVDQIIAETWKPRETAPAIATPHIGGPLSYWRTSFASLRVILEQTGRELEGLDLAEVVFPHFLCGAMDARQRLEFLRFHIERHHAQIERVMAHPDFPSKETPS
jgi:hypothetical protein